MSDAKEDAPLDHKHLIKAVKDGLEAKGQVLTKDEVRRNSMRHVASRSCHEDTR